ncbi:MAG TPA: hypothetical protein VJJ73_02640 [Candidatus Paceibacterota bacterium]
MRYAWVSLAVLAIWISAVLLITSTRIPDPTPFFFSVIATTIVLSYIGFRSL